MATSKHGDLMKSVYATLVIALAGLACAGCGQKGNLYLPNQKKPVPATRPQPNSPPPITPAAEPPPS
jgi:predicted small lipoprotein YifL